MNIVSCLAANAGGQGLQYFLDSFKNMMFVSMILQMFILSLAVGVDPYILKKQKKTMFWIIFLVFSLVIQNRVAYYLEFVKPAPFARTIESIWGYAVRPVVIVLFLSIVRPGKRLWILWLMAGVNAAVYLSALFSRLVFWITPENHFVRGPLTYSAHITGAILILVLLVYSFFEWNRLRRAEMLIPVMNALLVIAATLMDSFILHTEADADYLTVTIVSCCLFYYIWLHLKFVRDHEDALMAEQRIQLLMAQIKPHFIYNSLTAIRSYLDEPEKAEEVLDHFAGFLRGSIDFLEETGNIQADREFDAVENYLYMERERFGEKLAVETDIRDTGFSLPPFTVQTLVENAVSHGIRMNPSGRGTVCIRSFQSGREHIIEVEDDGPGFPAESGERRKTDPEQGMEQAAGEDPDRRHVGLSNIRQRLALMCGGTLEIESGTGQGTLARVRIPKDRNKEMKADEHSDRG